MMIIAHRLQYLERCTNIMSVVQGVVKEFGSHEELMKAQGPYYDLLKEFHN